MHTGTFLAMLIGPESYHSSSMSCRRKKELAVIDFKRARD